MASEQQQSQPLSTASIDELIKSKIEGSTAKPASIIYISIEEDDLDYNKWDICLHYRKIAFHATYNPNEGFSTGLRVGPIRHANEFLQRIVDSLPIVVRPSEIEDWPFVFWMSSESDQNTGIFDGIQGKIFYRSKTIQ